MRRVRKAKAKREIGGWSLIQFIPGGFYRFYHPQPDRLYTGVHQRVASDKITAKLLPLATRAIANPDEWTV